MPAVEDELRNVLAGAGAASLDPDEFIASGMISFTRTVAADRRGKVRPLALCSDRDRLIAADFPK